MATVTIDGKDFSDGDLIVTKDGSIVKLKNIERVHVTETGGVELECEFVESEEQPRRVNFREFL